MEARELRINNYLYKDETVVQIDARSIFDIDGGDKRYRPIKITEDLLVKLGFYKDEFDVNHWYELNVGGLKFITNDIGESGYSKKLELVFISEIDRNEKCEYLHQLQNLVKALTGEELTFNK